MNIQKLKKQVLAIVFTGLVACTPTTPEDNFKAFVASNAHKELINVSLSRLPPEVFKRCPSLVSKGSQVTVIKPVRMAQDGKPNAGMWKESFPVTGCGNDTILNFYYAANNEEKIKAIIGIPGTSIADPLLQKDGMVQAFAVAMKSDDKHCKRLFVTNTSFLGRVGDPMEGAKGSPWDELWTMDLCGTRSQVTMHFIPDQTGTTIHTSLQETKALNE